MGSLNTFSAVSLAPVLSFPELAAHHLEVPPAVRNDLNVLVLQNSVEFDDASVVHRIPDAGMPSYRSNNSTIRS